MALRTLILQLLALGARAVQLDHALTQGLVLAGGGIMAPAPRPTFQPNMDGLPMQNARNHAMQTMYGGVPMLTNILRQQMVNTAKAAVTGAGALLDLSMSEGEDVTMYEDVDEPMDAAPVGSTAMVGAAAAALTLLQLNLHRRA